MITWVALLLVVISTFVHCDGGISVLATFVQCQWLSASSLVGNRNCRIGNEMKNGTCLCSPLPETGMSWRDVVGSVAQCVIHVFPFMFAVSAFPTIVCHALQMGSWCGCVPIGTAVWKFQE